MTDTITDELQAFAELIRRKTGKEHLTPQDLREVLNDPEVAAFRARRKSMLPANCPPRPLLPEDAPQDFVQALYHTGPCAIPIWSADHWRFQLICDGKPIVDGRTHRYVSFDTYEEAIAQVRRWHAHKAAKEALQD